MKDHYDRYSDTLPFFFFFCGFKDFFGMLTILRILVREFTFLSVESTTLSAIWRNNISARIFYISKKDNMAEIKERI